MLFDLFGPLLGPLLIVIMVIVVFESCWRKCPPDKLMIVSGFGQTRSVSGKGTFVIPGLQRVDTLALGAVQVQLSTENEIPTQDAILIHACAVANFQIGQTPELIEIASKNYLNMDKTEMTRQVTEVMLGKMREVIGQMDLKELMRDRESFNHKVFEGSRDDLANLGLELRTFNVQDFSDSQGIIRSMGADQAAEIKKEAELAQIRAEQEVAERQNQLDLKKAELKKTADKAAAEADMVKQTVTAEKQRELYVAQQEAQIAAETKKVELAERQVAVKERELDAVMPPSRKRMPSSTHVPRMQRPQRSRPRISLTPISTVPRRRLKASRLKLRLRQRRRALRVRLTAPLRRHMARVSPPASRPRRKHTTVWRTPIFSPIATSMSCRRSPRLSQSR